MNNVLRQPIIDALHHLTIDLGQGAQLEMIAIQGGTFLMGAPKMEPDSYYEEQPQHAVTIPPFYMGKYLVTQAQWQAVMGNNPAKFKSVHHPVETVSWNEAQECIKKLNALAQTIETHGHASLQFRLPTEAEWEYACRAGTQTAYSFGNDPSLLSEYAWYRGNSDNETHPVGQKKPNNFGLHDMLGNVWEWCADTWHESYRGKGVPTDGSEWKHSGAQKKKALRGGSWVNPQHCCRCAYRINSYPNYTGDDIGFRLACAARTV